MVSEVIIVRKNRVKATTVIEELIRKAYDERHYILKDLTLNIHCPNVRFSIQ